MGGSTLPAGVSTTDNLRASHEKAVSDVTSDVAGSLSPRTACRRRFPRSRTLPHCVSAANNPIDKAVSPLLPLGYSGEPSDVVLGFWIFRGGGRREVTSVFDGP